MLILTACAPSLPINVNPTMSPTAALATQIVSRPAQVQSVDIQFVNSDPVQAKAVVRGNLTEACSTLGESQVQYAANAFQITVFVNSRADIGCVQVTTPFETTIPLDTKYLPAGNYTVTANGVSTVFALPSENAAETPEPTAVAASTSSPCIDSASFVADVTIPDNSVVGANTAFTKTWRIKNTGTCTWDNSYLVVYVSGATMSQQPGYWIVPQGQTVAPDQTVDISVGMTAPLENGSYVSYWGLKKENGQLMPVQGGVNYRSFYVKIKVNDGATTTGNITTASIGIELEQGSGTVCSADATYFVHAYITADGPTTASYEVNSTAGQIPAGYFQPSPMGPASVQVTGPVVFDQAGTQTISLRFVGPYPYPRDITVNLRVDEGDWYSTKVVCQ